MLNMNHLISLKNTAQFHVLSRSVSEKCVFLYSNNWVKKQPPWGSESCTASNVIKTRLQRRRFPVEFVTFLRALILENICERLLLWVVCFAK